MTGDMPEVYEGDRSYAFVGYSHDDMDVVLPIICALVGEGYRVWYDDGIGLATDYLRKVAHHVYGCAFFIMFVSRASLGSKWCNDELNYALDLGKHVLPVYLEEVELTRDLQMRMGRTQSIYWYKLSDDVFYRRLFGVRLLDCCLSDEGRRNRGVKARGDKTRASCSKESQQSRLQLRAGSKPDSDPLQPSLQSLMVVGKFGGSSGVVKRDKLVDYEWWELKEISQLIAAADSDENGLAIARTYGLVDGYGKLQGEKKSLILKNGRKTSIRILGFRHDDLASGGKAGISFEFADVPARYYMNTRRTNRGGWERSEMRWWLNGEFFLQLPNDLRACVEAARKRTNNRGDVRWEDDTSVVTHTDDKLWLLSMSEIYGRVFAQEKNVAWSSATYDTEGIQYKLYTDKGVSTTNYYFCAKDGANSLWWLRSPHARDSRGFLLVSPDGDWYYGNASRRWGVSPGFCL